MTRDEKLDLIADLASQFGDWVLDNLPEAPRGPYTSEYLRANEAWQNATEWRRQTLNDVASFLGFGFAASTTISDLRTPRIVADDCYDPTPIHQHEVTEGRDVSEPLPQSAFPQ